MSEEERVMKRISKILSEREPKAAASVARQVADSCDADTASEEPDDPEPPKTEPHRLEDDSSKPAFMRTQHRMTIGKQILERASDPAQKRSASPPSRGRWR